MKKTDRANEKETENISIQQEASFASRVMSHVPMGLAAVRVKNGIPLRLKMNPYLVQTFELERDEVEVTSIDTFLSYIHLDDYPASRQDLIRLFEEGIPLDSEGRFRIDHIDRYIWMQVKGVLTGEPGGDQIAYLTFTDIEKLKEVELALRQSRRMYNEAVTVAGLRLWEYDIPNRRITIEDNEIGRQEMARFGWPRVIENVPDSMVGGIDDKDVPAFMKMYDEVIAGRDASCQVWYKEQPGQETRYEGITYTVVFDAEGRPVRAHGIGQNLTAQQKIKERYKREIENMRAVSDADLLGRGHYSLTRNRVIQYASFGVASSPALPERYDDAARAFVNLAYNKKECRAILDKISRKNLIRRYREGDFFTTVQYRCTGRGGALLWVSTVLHTYMDPDTGELECFTYTRDVTQRVFKEQIIRKMQILGYEELGMIYVDTGQFKINWMDKVYRESSTEDQGDTYDERIMEHIKAGIPEKDWAAVRKALSLKTICDGLEREDIVAIPVSMEVKGRFCRKLFQFTYLDGDRDTIFFCLTDITRQYEEDQRHIAELSAAKLEADKANQAKSTFLSSMSHDLRTPLNGILGFSEIALQEDDPEKKQDYLTKIQMSGKLLLALVNDTLELSRIESGKMELKMEKVDNWAFWDAIANAVRLSMELKNIHFHTNPAAYPRKIIWVDPIKVQKIALNLLSNAAKYTPEGGNVTFTVEELDPPVAGCTRRITVRDDGIGMDPDFLERLYEPFAQENRPEAKNVVGTGLGLSIVKRIVDLMNGRIQVESAPGKGTCFTVDLPVLYEEAHEQKKACERAQTAILAGRRVLLCEDNRLNREIAQLLLRNKGITMDFAEDGRAGVKAFMAAAPGTYDAVLMDIRMPVMDGYQATAAIRRLDHPDAAAVPIIAMTADAFEEDVRHAKEAGMDGYVTKPIDPPVLYEALREAFERGGSHGR